MRTFQRQTSAAADWRSDRSGSVLLVVLVLITMLALGAYSFSELMVSESHATNVFGREAQVRASADSGIELAAAVLGRPADDGSFENVFHDPAHFGGVTLKDTDSARGRARFSLVAANESDLSGSSIRFGLMDESAKLNLNALVVSDSKSSSSSSTTSNSSGSTTSSSGTGSTSGTSTTNSSTTSGSNSTSGTLSSDPFSRLMMIPGMTEEYADLILDFIDSDDSPRPFGGESDSASYVTKNAPLDSLDELLAIPVITPLMLYGEDANRNGLLDANENDGDASWPPDNADGTLQLGWSAYLTAYGREKNLRWDNSPRININNNNLAELYDQLEEEYDATVAQFVIAFRVNVQTATTGTGSNSSGNNTNSNNNSSGGSRASSGGGNTTTANLNQQYSQLQQAAQSLGSALGGGSGAVTRGGMDLSKGATRQVTSLYELIGAEVNAVVDGTPQKLQSPWASSPNDMIGYLPSLLDTLSTNDNVVIDGRININEARRETLLAIPGISENQADMILAKRQGADGSPLVDTTGTRTTAGWLVIENVVDLDTMKQLDKYVTARGGIYRVQSIGFYDEAGPFRRLEAIIDTTQSNKPPVIRSLQDLSDLGRGYPPAMLVGGQ